MFTCKPDFENAQKRVNLFWNRADTDRPLVSIVFRKPGAAPFPEKQYAAMEDSWLDVEYRAEAMAHHAANTVFYAEAMPVFHPNLGPEVFSAWAGCPMEYSETTTWAVPCISDWAKDGPGAVVDWSHPLFALLEKFTKLLLELGKGRFIIGLTDFHPGGDHIAALRDPEKLATDLLDFPDEVKAKLESSYGEYFPVFDHFVKMIKEYEMPISTWLPLTSETSMYVPSNDFSCMVGTEMFEEFFIDGIIRECRHYGQSIYHLDGPDALRHLDRLLEIKELNAIQWVPGAGREEALRWMDVYKKVLAGGKGINIGNVRPSDLDTLMEHLPAKGVWLSMQGIHDEETAETVMKKIAKWPERTII
jgi:hypothetical protein